jgi:hypothetical protein
MMVNTIKLMSGSRGFTSGVTLRGPASDSKP